MVSRLVALATTLALLAPVAEAQDRRASHCIAIAEAPGITYLHKTAFASPLPDFTVRLNYVDHSMFLLETPGGLRAVTDYNGFVGATRLPDVVTMNRAHITHWTPDPDPAIPHILRGWSDRVGEAVDHYVDLGEMVVRSVSTDIRSSGSLGVETNGNSIFVFEVEGLCIGHLGHLHHEPDARQYAALGRLDVVMAPVDGGLTLDLPTMIRTLKQLRASVVVPMHWFSDGSLDRFVEGMADDFDIDRRGTSFLEVSLNTLPRRPTVVVLRPSFLTDPQ